MKNFLLMLILIGSHSGSAQDCNPAIHGRNYFRTLDVDVSQYSFSITIDKTDDLSFTDGEEIVGLICKEVSSIGALVDHCKYDLSETFLSRLNLGSVTHRYMVRGTFKRPADESEDSLIFKENVELTLANLASSFSEISDYQLKTEVIGKKPIKVLANTYKCR